MTDGRLLPYGLVLVALLIAGAAAAVWVDARRGRRVRALEVMLVDDPHSPSASGDVAGDSSRSTDAFDVRDETRALPIVELHPAKTRRPTGRHARPESEPGENPLPVPALSPVPLLMWMSQPATATESYDLGLFVDRQLSSVDLSFPYPASLADSLHDELFTHRTVRS